MYQNTNVHNVCTKLRNCVGAVMIELVSQIRPELDSLGVKTEVVIFLPSDFIVFSTAIFWFAFELIFDLIYSLHFYHSTCVRDLNEVIKVERSVRRICLNLHLICCRCSFS